MVKYGCTDVCELIIDVVCLKCPKCQTCLFRDVDDDFNESDFHKQLLECLNQTEFKMDWQNEHTDP